MDLCYRLWEERHMKMSVLLSDEEGERFCAYCAEKGYKKSTLIARLVREYLDREAFAAQPQLFPAAPRGAASKAGARRTKRPGAARD
jgi:hypothetical protein